MSVFHDHDCDNCPVYKACGWFGDILVKPRCFVDDKCDPDIYVPDLSPLDEVVKDEDMVLVAVPKECVECCTPSEAGCACCVVWQDNEKEGGE